MKRLLIVIFVSIFYMNVYAQEQNGYSVVEGNKTV